MNALEARLSEPNEFSEAKLLQAIQEKYGQASEGLLRLQQTIEAVNASNALLASAQPTLAQANALSVVKAVEPLVQNSVTQPSLVVMYGSRRDKLYFMMQGGNPVEIRNPSEYDNSLCSIVHLTLPGDSFVVAESCIKLGTTFMLRSHLEIESLCFITFVSMEFIVTKFKWFVS